MSDDPWLPGGPFQGLLNDLLKVIGSSGGRQAWLETARALAVGVATDGGEDRNVDPLERIAFEELARIAELHVADATGLPISSVPFVLTPVSRGAFASRALEAWRPLLERMVDAQHGSFPSASDAMADEGLGAGPDLAQMLGRLSSTMGPIMLGMQFGASIGHLAQRALGQYAIAVPWPPARELLVVPENVARFAADWSLPEDASRLWACVRQVMFHAVFSRSHVVARMDELLNEAASEAVGVQRDLTERLTRELSRPEELQQLLSDPEAVLADLLSPGQRTASARLTALATALEGYVDHFTSAITTSTTGSSTQLREAWYRYRSEDSSGHQSVGAIFGLDLGRSELDRGVAFVRGVLERAGEDGLRRLLDSPWTLPTPAEVDAPGLWLERINLPEEPSGTPPSG